jgi:polysaccharide biosynthesis transport protein
MDIKGYLAILWGNKWVILLTLFVTVAVATAITLLITPTYTASTTLRIATSSSGVASSADYMYADRLMNTYTKLATSRPVLEEVAQKLDLKTLPEFSVVTIPNTELIKISAESSDPMVAKNSTNTLAEIIIAQGKQLYSGGGKSTQEILGEQLKQAEDELNQARRDLETFISQSPDEVVRIAAMNEAIKLKEATYSTLLEQYDQARLREMIRADIISVVDPAVLPLTPSKPNKPLNIGLGMLVGLAGGVGLAFLFENMNARLYTSKQIENTAELNSIGKIPKMTRKSLDKLWNRDDKNFRDPINEAFRRLRVQIFPQNPDNFSGKELKTLLITSAEPGEGKSTIAAHLAIAFAQSGKKVIVIDCDLHMPRQHKINGLPNKVGLSSVLVHQINLEAAVQGTNYPGMYVLTSGPLLPNPANLLGSPQMKSLLMTLSLQYDLVLLDTPAYLVVADTAILASIVDGVVLVARRNFIREEAVREVTKQLADIKVHMIGLVVNDAEPNGSYYYYHQR